MSGTVRPSTPVRPEPAITPFWESQISLIFKPHLQFCFLFLTFRCACLLLSQSLVASKIVPFLLDTFVTFRKTAIGFVIFVCPAVRMGQLGSLWTEFRKTSYGCVSLALPAVWTLLCEITRFFMKWAFQVWNACPLHVLFVLVSFCNSSEGRSLFDKTKIYWME